MAGEDGIKLGHHSGQYPNQACTTGGAPAALGSTNNNGEYNGDKYDPAQ